MSNYLKERIDNQAIILWHVHEHSIIAEISEFFVVGASLLVCIQFIIESLPNIE